jgi:hypothetical protein
MIAAIDHSVVVAKDLAEQDRDGAKYVLVLDTASFYLDAFSQQGTNYVGTRKAAQLVVVSSHDAFRLYAIDVCHVVTTRDAMRHNITAAKDARAVASEFQQLAGEAMEPTLATITVPAPVHAPTGQYL